MTEASPGPDWWQASDGRWYPPHLHPRAQAEATQSDAPHATTTATVMAHEPIDWERVAAEREQRRKREERKHRLRIVAAIVVGLAVLGGLYLFVRSGDDGDSGQTSTDAGPDVETTVAPQTTTATADAPGSTPAPTSAAPGSTDAPESTDAPQSTAAPGASATPTTAAPDAEGATLVSVFDVQPGTCIDDPGLASGLVTDLRSVPCEQPHTHEVFQKVTYAPADGAFDAAQISAFANEQCAQAFAAYVGIPYDQSMYYFLHLAPSEQSWNEQDDRDVLCLLFLQSGPMTGSAKGTAQ